jgi:hypothetical protein
MPIWTKEADSLLIELMNAGCSMGYVASELSKFMSYKITRNAVAGRKFRLPEGLFHLTTGGCPRSPKRQKPREARTREHKRFKPVTITLSNPAPPEPQFEPEGVNYMDLQPDGCKAILDKRGELDLPMVCGRLRGYDDKGARSSYCRMHYERYNNPQPGISRRVVDYGQGSKIA